MSFEKITKVKLPFDRRHKDPHKNYGISGLTTWFILKGSKGAVQFMIGFDVYLPHLYQEYKNKGHDLDIDYDGRLKSKRINGWDIGYHALEPQYEDQPTMDCELFEGKKCYYDGSSLRAEEWANEIFSIKGKNLENVIWDKLEQEYKERFGEI